jgi:uncharacterized protein (UPF0276 family)
LKFALNYSPEAAELLQTGQIELDLFKCADWDDMIATASARLPIYVHFPLHAGAGHTPDLERVARLRTQTNTRYVNMHLGGHIDALKIPLETQNPAHTELVAQTMIRDVQQVTQRFGAENVILENVPWDPQYGIPRPAITAELIRRVIEATGCGLLLDLAHARMAALYLGVDVREYITHLPVDRLRELHVTGVDFWQGQLIDHLPMTHDDWILFEWALENIAKGTWRTPDIIALEYGGLAPHFDWRSEKAVMLREVPRITTAVRAAIKQYEA